jgi:N-acetylglucosamine-6-sulfatase
LGLSLVGCSSSAANQPNIIFILTDDLDYASAQQLPRLPSLFSEVGAAFENAFVSHPQCCPSRATILTGLYDHNHHVTDNKPPEGGFVKFASEGREKDSIAVSLQGAGYRTALFGKYLNGYPSDDLTYVPPGWDEWYAKLDKEKLYNYRINENGKVVSYGNSTNDFFTDVLSSQATGFLRNTASDSRPFFMYVAPTAPHGPSTPAERHRWAAYTSVKAPRPPSFNEEDFSDKPSWIRGASPLSEEEIKQINQRYRFRLASMLSVEEMVSSLLQELEASGKLDNTFIFFTSDNGWEQGEHRLAKGKDLPYEESARVPLFVRGPGVTAGSKVRELTLNTDFAPTFAELAGISYPADGRSLVPLLHGENPWWRSAILLERTSPKGVYAQENTEKKDEDEEGNDDEITSGASGRAVGKPNYAAVRTESHTYVEYTNGDRELYDLEADPYQLNNIYEEADPTVLSDLETRLGKLRGCSSGGCQKAEDTY